MSKFEEYFNKDFIHLKDNEIDINCLLSENMYLISGDFYGIQKFIFEGLTTKNAAKVLRAKSAFVQLFTSVISKYICSKLQIDEKCILTQNAGKFEILSPKMDENIINEIQKTVNEYFIKTFYGLSGINICFVSCDKNDFQVKFSQDAKIDCMYHQLEPSENQNNPWYNRWKVEVRIHQDDRIKQEILPSKTKVFELLLGDYEVNYYLNNFYNYVKWQKEILEKEAKFCEDSIIKEIQKWMKVI